jgi:hypothetical protein
MGEMERIPMSHVTIVNRSQLFAAATAISALGLLTIPTPAQAGPMLPLAPLCHQYQFPGNITLRQDNGEVVLFSSYGFEARGVAMATGANGHQAQGTVSGGMNGLKDVDFTIHYNDAVGGQIHYTGTVSDDGYVHGGAQTGQLSGSGHWDLTERPLGCVVDPAPAPAQQPAPPAQTAAARLGVAVNGPTTLTAGQSGIYTVNLSNSGDTGAPVELYVSFGGNLQQSGQVTPSGGVNCEVINNAGGTTSVHCTVPQFQSKATANIVVQGRGSAPGAGHLTVNINSSDPGAQFVQKSQGLNVSIT